MSDGAAIGSLYQRTQELLRSSCKTTAEIYRETNLPYHWLNQVREGRSRDPSVNRVQALYEYLTGTQLEVK